MIHVIGISGGLEDLSPRKQALLSQAEVLVASKRLLKELAQHPAYKIPITSPFSKVFEEIKAFYEKEIVVLTSGDPLFYGLGKRLCEIFPLETLCFYPAPSSIQEAFARLKMSWEDAKIISLHNRKPRNLHLEIAPYRKVAFFTDPLYHPGAISSYLLEKGVEGEVFVCENLGLPEERIVRGRLSEIRGRKFSPLNVMVLIKDPTPRRLLFGLPEEHYSYEKGLITKAEVRASIVSALAPFPEATVWDLGAGSGAVGLELARLCFQGETYLVERDVKRVQVIRQNLVQSGLDNVIVIHKSIAQALSQLPPPDLIFVGGGWEEVLGQKEGLLSALRPGVRLAGTFITFEPLLKALEFFEGWGFEVRFSSLWVARGRAFPHAKHGLSCLNPVFLLMVKGR